MKNFQAYIWRDLPRCYYYSRMQYIQYLSYLFLFSQHHHKKNTNFYVLSQCLQWKLHIYFSKNIWPIRMNVLKRQNFYWAELGISRPTFSLWIHLGNFILKKNYKTSLQTIILWPSLPRFFYNSVSLNKINTRQQLQRPT